MPWPVASLGEVVTINPRGESLGADDEVSFVGMAELDAETGVARQRETRAFSEVSKGYTIFRDRDVLAAKITPCWENGKVGQARLCHAVGVGSTEFHVLRPSNAVDDRYLLHFLRQPSVRQDGERRMTGSAGQRRVPVAFLADLKLPLPPLEEQRRIADVLDRAAALRVKRREALALLEDLAQSIFLDMFGDPAVNPWGWPHATLGQLSEVFSDGPFGSNLKSSHYVDEGVRVVRLQNIGVGRFLDRDQAYISTAHFDRLRKHQCRPGDVLIGTLGDPNLRACLQPDSVPVALNKADCVQMRVRPDVADACYVVALLNQPSVAKMAQSLTLGQTRLRISMGRLRGLNVPNPPLSLQKDFAAIIESISSDARRLVASAHRFDELFTSVQQRAFAGLL